MGPDLLLLLLLGFGLAFGNGANDVSKGIATLVGSGVANEQKAIAWGTLWTGIGAASSAVLGTAMVGTLGAGLLADGTTRTAEGGLATLFGAAAWVALATRVGAPVSSTHAIVGALVGVAAVAYGIDGVRWDAVGSKIVAPLLLTPALSAVAVLVLLTQRSSPPSGSHREADDCLCMELAAPVAAAVPAASLRADAPALLQISTGAAAQCAAERPGAGRLTWNGMHWWTAGATSMARGMNDAPKIAALLLAVSSLRSDRVVEAPALFAVVTIGMLAGSATAGLRVTRVLAEKVTPMNHREGFLANLVTSVLVSAGAVSGLPMSTTHVSVGGIAGVGARRCSLDRSVLTGMLAAWLVTAPCSAALGIAAWSVLAWWS